ncbi:LysR family transcriptional regulator [Nocardioides allogilvus]|uniref:LysR family transcriptional regulator n=1 Tax=Nocardioides allogilvus TaxID=2072017 RepID=UPI000D317109|nr:LysR family transcriptional regulator [Nocardioides allogilvus]
MSFTLRQLRYFLAVCEVGQVSAAARELYVSQSSVTTAIQEIERVLEQPLFIRGSRGVSPTDVGLAFLPKAREIVRMADEAARVTIPDALLSGRVRVGVTYTVMAYFVPQHIQKIASLYPHLEVEWREMGRPEVEAQLDSGELDFGLMLTSNLQSPLLQCETFVHSKRRLWLAPTHPLAGAAQVPLTEIARHPYVLLTVDEAAETTRQYWGELRPRVFLKTSSIEAVRSIVANGNGITILSDMVYRPWSLEGKRVETRVPQHQVPDMKIGLAWRRGASFTGPMKTLQDYCHRQYAVTDVAGSGLA